MRIPTQARFWRRPLDAEDMTLARGVVHVQEDRCKGCAYCTEFCPSDVLELSERYNLKGYHPPDVVRPAACSGCQLCEILCPEFAIVVHEQGAAPRRVSHAL